ncbi:MAG: DUF2933 domain-containing protein [Acidobacteriota bacterium]
MCMHNLNDHNGSGRNQKTNWLPWLLVAGMGIILFLNTTGSLSAAKLAEYLPYALFFLCPLMMLFHGCGHSHAENTRSNGSCHDHESHKPDSQVPTR